MESSLRRFASAAFIGFSMVLAAAAAFADSPLTFDMNLAPNTSGSLEGSASLRLRWASFAESALLFSSTGFVDEYDEGAGTTTVIRSQKTLDLELYRSPSDLLALRLGNAGRVSASGVFMVDGVILDEDKYGQGPSYIYYVGQQTKWLKPLLGGDLSCSLGPISTEVYYRTSWPFTLNEYLEGAANYSIPLSEPVAFSVADEGFETRLGGQLSLKLAPAWTLRGELDWVRHIGHSVATSSGVAVDYVYESRHLETSLQLTFPMGARRPTVGVAYVSDDYSPLEQLYDEESYSNSRLRFLFGLEL